MIAFDLRHRKEVDEYLQVRREEVERLGQEIETRRPNPAELRAKVLDRKKLIEREHSSSGK